MAKNTGSAAFRHLDVDSIVDDEDKEEDEVETTAPALGPDESEVNSLLSQSRHADALKAALRNAPLKTKDLSAKARATGVVVRVLSSVKAVDIESALKTLDKDQVELLLKYVYKGFETPQDNSSAVLLNWHDKLFAIGGEGAIVRVLTDKKRL